LESYDVLNSVCAYRETLSLVVSEFDSKEEKKILDIGFGTGNFAIL
jgi:ubiquinone/menaquinone biosynthesis C-methylase UbiE